MRLEQATSEAVASLAARVAGAPGPLGPSVRLDEFGFDSLAFVEFGVAVRDEFGLEIRDVALPVTIADLVGLVDRAGPPSSRRTIPPGIGRRQQFVRRALDPAMRWFFKLRSEGVRNLPRTGPAILCLNHDSAIDVVVTTVSVPRSLIVMGKKEVFITNGVSRAFHEMGGFPVDRDRWDRRAVEISLAALDEGAMLAMWPEGTRAAHELLPFLPGAAWLALARGVPLVPAAIVGSGRAWPRDRLLPRRHPIEVIFGEAIEVQRLDDPNERLKVSKDLTDDLRTRVAALLRSHGSTLRGLNPV